MTGWYVEYNVDHHVKENAFGENDPPCLHVLQRKRVKTRVLCQCELARTSPYDSPPTTLLIARCLK